MRAPDAAAAISVHGLTLAYGRTTILDHIDLALPRGAFTVLLGPNGCGKSTLLKTMSGLLAPRQGQVHIGGEALSKIPARQLARRIGLLSQDPQAPEGLTVEDLVQQGRYPHRPLFARWTARDQQACSEALRLTGLEPLRTRALDSLSGGQRQRAWISLTLAQQTEILLLDEPTTFLDLAHQIEVLDLVSGLVHSGGKTVVAVLHDINQAARYAHHLVLMKDGRVRAEGSPHEILTAARIADVFGVRAEVITDPFTGSPLCIPLPQATPFAA